MSSTGTAGRTPPYATLLIAALSLFIPFVNYGFSGELIGGDAATAWALPDAQLRQVVGIYVDGPGLGFNGATGLAAAFPALSLAALLHAILPTALVARLIIALYYFLAMTGALKLFEAVLPQGPLSRSAALTGALFYGVNRYTVLLYFTAQTYFPMVYSALPWLVYGVIVGCEQQRRRGIAIVVIALIWAGGAGSNPALFGVALCAVAAAAVFELLAGVPWRRVAGVAGAGALVGLGCCAWWILPLFTSVGAGLDTLSAASVPNWAQWMSERSSFLNLFKLDGYTGTETMPFSDWFASPIGSMLGYVPIIVGIAGFGVYRRRFSSAVLVAFLTAAFLSKGVHGPFGGIYQALLDHVPGFSIFRSPYVKWIALEAVLLALFFVLGIAGVAARLRDRLPQRPRVPAWFVAGTACAVIAYPWAAYAGRMLSPDASGVGFLSSLPSAYREVAAIIDRDAHGARTVVFGGGARPYPLYTWRYFGDDPLWVAAQSPIAPFETLLPNAPQMSSDTLAAALRALGVRFVVVHHDVRNVLPSPQASVLVAAGAARRVFRSPELELYRLRGAIAAPVEVLAAPLLALERSPAVADDRISERAPGRLDPNLGLMLAKPGPLEVLAPAGRATAAPADAARLGWIEDVTDAPAAAPSAAELAFVPGNPLAVLEQPAFCGSREALRLVAPVRWRWDGHDLGGVSAKLCLSGRRVSQLVVGGNLPNEQVRAISLVNGRPLALDVPEAGTPGGVAHRLLRQGLPFALEFPRTTSLLQLMLPFTGRAANFSVVMRTSEGKPIVAGGPSVADVVVVKFANPIPAGTKMLAYVTSFDPSAYVALQNVREIPFSVGGVTSQRLWLDIDQRPLQSLALTRDEAARPARALSVERLPTADTDQRGLVWGPNEETPLTAWSVKRGRIRLRSAGTPAEVHAEGSVAANSRYRLRFSYRASGYAELWTRTGGADVDRITHLVADGSSHTFSGRLFPPVGSNGAFIIRLRSSAGILEARDVALSAEGPNGVLLAWHRNPPLAGRLLAWNRPFPWLFRLHLDDCRPCVVRLGVSDPSNWLIRGASVDARFTSAGGSTGPWAAITTGAATWLMDAGPGTRDVDVIFVPALVAGAGLMLSLLTAGLCAPLLVRASRAPLAVPPEQPGSAVPPGVLAGLAALALVAALLGGAFLQAGEFFANVLWIGLAAVGVLELFRAVRRVRAA